jgi:hypothetical protein
MGISRYVIKMDNLKCNFNIISCIFWQLFQYNWIVKTWLSGLYEFQVHIILPKLSQIVMLFSSPITYFLKSLTEW